MKFLQNWKIETSKVPAYGAFKKEFIIDVDYKLLEMMSEFKHPEITEDRLKLLRPLLQTINKQTNKLIVSYYHPFNLGRFYPKNSLSPINVSRHFKHSLFSYMNWFDLDMVRGHPSIIFSIAKNNNIHLPTFEKYLTNRDEVVSQLLNHYQTEKPENDENWKPLNEKDIKDIFNITIYGGSHTTWEKQMAENGKEIGTTLIHPIEKEFVKECRMIMDTIYNSNPDILERVKGEEKNEYKLKSKVMSYFCGTIENEILHIAYKFLCERGVIKNDIVLLEYDGLCFPNPNINNLSNIIDELNYNIREKTKINVKMTLKNYDEEYIHKDIIEKRKMAELPIAEIVEENDEIPVAEIITNNPNKNDISFYQKWKTEFELSHFKVINKSFFMKIIKDQFGFIQEFKPFSKTDIITSYEHITFMDYSGMIPVPKACIREWISDDTIRSYEDMKLYPPPLKCPENIFNLWTPFYAETLMEKYCWNVDDKTEEKQAELLKKRDSIIQHMKILCNHNETDFIYFSKWIGQMLKYPAFKTTCITLISEEGAGKGTFIHLLHRMMGESKVLETAEPQERVWGKFNGCMMDAFFVNCNEMELKIQQEAESRIKTLITDTKGLYINEKNIKGFKLDSYHRFMITSNKQVPVKTHSKDRRYKIIRTSDEKLGDTDYFDTLRSYINDDKVLLLMYEYFTTLPGLDKFHLEKIVQNEYQQILAESFNKSIPQLFMEQFTLDNYDEGWVEKSSTDLITLFDSFKSKNKFIFECDAVRLMRNINLLNFPDGCMIKRHTKKGNMTNFNIGLLKQHFKLENLED